jgi:hypothetical protein
MSDAAQEGPLHLGEILAVALVVASSLVCLAAREVAVGRDEAAEAEAAASRSDWIEAVAHARAAAEATAPWSPWPERGARRLESLARDAEVRGDDTTALLAWGALRSAAIATRGLGHDTSDWRAAAEHGIARVAQPDVAARDDRDRDAGGVPYVPGTELRRRDFPSDGSIALLGASLAAAVIGVARLARPRFATPSLRWAAALVAGGFLAYAAVLLMNGSPP